MLILLKPVDLDDPILPFIIAPSLGCPSYERISQIIKSYAAFNHQMIGAFKENFLIGLIGSVKKNTFITIRHISILKKFQKQAIGRLMIHHLKKNNPNCKIFAETDEESIIFYQKCGFLCKKIRSIYKTPRYQCVIES